MHIGKAYTFKEVINWTRRDILQLGIISTIPVILYIQFQWKWLQLPWLPIALIGTAVAFVVGFKNNAAYDRLWEARRIWGSITNLSRSWGVMVRDYVTNQHSKNPLSDTDLSKIHLELYNRHFAWLTAMRFQLRENKPWEAINLKHNLEYRNTYFTVQEHTQDVKDVLKKYLTEAEFNKVIGKTNKASYILALQSEHLKRLFELGLIDNFRHMELEKILIECYNQQGGSERIKNFPYPRHFASLNAWFIKIFIFLMPFGMIEEFEKLGPEFVWLTIPFASLAGWIFITMERIGESTENPFEGSANDVPISTISHNIEIDMLELLDLQHNLKSISAQNNILT
ncbi:MAG TPA: bestrophin family ion channel [Leptospiraceae bacterium]|nr:bestrophin family ion channel [Leptospiraceae bacterium]HMW06939.1 bestrophin family ion channel [Leptospiraceae bacterium]HMX32300.1 bestrophin family ion channel [Leptospiraceae bacterium]HMY30593.1 bestrophin family ion channel [Leptospiraceae bacterium]HMZ66718.1 bestrophin family ion channel [Leptospiraceae bacterium]